MKVLLRKPVSQLWRLVLCRCISTGSAAFDLPLHYLDGCRMQPSGSDGEEIVVQEPATGNRVYGGDVSFECSVLWVASRGV